MTITEVPELVPARMLNEYAYCPRLFFLEWVDQLWAPSSDTAEGDRQHRRVDAGGGAAPLPSEGEVKAARSVELSSEKLGIIAQLDLLEGEDGGVVPVDTKKGLPSRDGTAWEADAVQVCAQVLLLREHGYAAERGEIFYAETRQRVRVTVTPELMARTMQIVEEARAVATRLAPPPPLQSSPKCPRCSLAGICLPDETHVLAGRQHARPRRLVAADPDAVPLYVTEPGSVVGIDGGRLTISKYRELLASVRLIDVQHVCAYGNVQVTAQAMRELFSRDVDVFHFSGGGWLLGLTTGLPSKNVMLRIRQVTAAARGQLDQPRRMIAGKIRNCRVLLRRNGGEAMARRVGQLAALAEQAERAEDPASLLGIEGTAARLYFEAFPSLLAGADALPGPAFTGLRNRRPPSGRGELPAVVLLWPAGQGAAGFLPRGWLRPVHRAVSPPEVRPSGARTGSGRGVPAAARRLHRAEADQQPGDFRLRLPGPRRGGNPDRRRPQDRDKGLGTADDHACAAPDVRVPGQLPSRGRAAGQDPRRHADRRAACLSAAGHQVGAYHGPPQVPGRLRHPR